MAKIYMVTETEMDSLLEQLELRMLREKNVTRAQTSEEMHRGFHYVVTRWIQDTVGYKGVHRNG